MVDHSRMEVPEMVVLRMPLKGRARGSLMTYMRLVKALAGLAPRALSATRKPRMISMTARMYQTI